MNYKKDRSYIKQRLEYVSSVDYISELEGKIENLQNENEIISQNYERLYNEDCRLREEKNIDDITINLLDENYYYKQRIDKAIEYIENHQPVFELSSKKQISKWFYEEYYINLSKILGGNKDEKENKYE